MSKFFARSIALTCLLMALLMTQLLPMLLAQDKPKEDLNESLRKVLSDPAFIKLNLQAFRKDQYGSTAVPDEAVEHPEGIFRMWQMSGSIAVQEPLHGSFYGQHQIRFIDPTARFPTKDECMANALAFITRQYPWFVEPGTKFVLMSATPPDKNGYSFPGVWSFGWIHPGPEGEEDLYSKNTSVFVRAIDGKIVSFGVGGTSWPEHQLKLPDAKRIALALIEKRSFEPVRNVHMVNAYLPRKGERDHGYWRLTFEADSISGGRNLRGKVMVDSATGATVVDSYKKEPVDKVYWREVDSEQSDGVVGDVYSPIWASGQLICVGKLSIKGLPSWVKLPKQFYAIGKTGKVQWLTADFQSKPEFISGLGGGSTAGISRSGWTYALNLESGEHRILGMPERPGDTPTIDPDGKWAVVSGTGRDRNTDLDLLPDDLSTRGETLGNRGRLVSKGDDHHPLFSPDNKWLYFVTTSEANGKATQALRRIPAALAHTKSVVNLKPTQIETIIPNFASQVLRLSIFPNGQKMLLQTEKEMVLLSIADKKATPLTLKNLKDAEVNAPITETRDGWAGPSDNEVTFSGKTTDKDGKIRWRIYSCRFDGSSLKAWTPKENQPVEAYKFPNAPDGKTAIDLAKQWALKEIEFEDYLKRQGR